MHFLAKIVSTPYENRAQSGPRPLSFAHPLSLKVSFSCIEFALPFQHSPRSVIAQFIATTYGADHESDSAISADLHLIAVGGSLLAVYGLIVLAKNHPVASASWLAIASIGSISLAVLCSFGFAAAVGVKFTLVEQVNIRTRARVREAK